MILDPRPPLGARLLFRWRKWDASPHWLHECVYLGSDEWGDWLGQLPGWGSVRPGREVVPRHPSVTLVARSGDFAFTHNAAPAATRIYIDLAWDLRWEDGEPRGIDMDLDVVEHEDLGIYIDDRDEWDEHRALYRYPLDIVAHLEALTLDLERRVTARQAPFDSATTDAWLGRLAALDLR